MAWVLTVNLTALRSAFRSRFPNSTTLQDGTIGDTAHQQSTSGHNPDDTPGSRSEYSDADTKPEVRALDKDSRLNSPTVDMQGVINAILATPADRDRLAYIIFNGYIWRKRNGGKRETYTGSDKHRTHAHFSGDPAHDESGAPWTSVLNAGGALMAGLIDNAERAVTAFYTGQDPVPFPAPWDETSKTGYPNPMVRLEEKVDKIQETLDKVLQAFDALSAAGVSQSQLDSAVLHAVQAVRFDTRAVVPGETPGT
jgi:hypothetical protein